MMSTLPYAGSATSKPPEFEPQRPVLANDFRRQWEDLRADYVNVLDAVGRSGWYVLGEEVREFESSLAQWWGVGYSVGVASGLDAIEIGLRVLGCRAGDRVLTTPLTAFATTLAILKLGAVPVFVDTDERGLIDLERCRELLRSRRDIGYFVPVHLYGHSLDLGALGELRKTYGIQIVEDCAQSIGASFRGKPTGSAGDLAATSFYPTKNLGAMGHGGALLTNDDGLRTRALVLRDYGQAAKYRHEWIGYNSRLDELQAAFLRRVSLPRLEHWTERRREIARVYLDRIHNPEVKLLGAPTGSISSWHLFPVWVKPEKREGFLQHLKATGIGTGIHYPATVVDQPALSGVAHEGGDCPRARYLAAAEVSLPIHPYLTDAEVERVIEAVDSWKG
jgi:dTDP-3-amino-3,4,6-trideoxy-alpha-D-glucose transaminase